MGVGRQDQKFDQKSFLAACDAEEEIRFQNLASAQRSHQTFHVDRNYATMKERMMIGWEYDELKRRTKSRKRIYHSKGLPHDIQELELTAAESLICESVFFGTAWHTNCHEMCTAKERIRGDTVTSSTPSGKLQVTDVGLKQGYSASELQYMLLRYFPNPDFGLNSRWTKELSDIVAYQVADYLKNIHGVPAQMATLDDYTQLSPFEWENIGSAVERIGFACHQHCKHKLLEGIKNEWDVNQRAQLVLMARKAGFSAEGVRDAQNNRTSTFEEVWSHIAASPLLNTKTPWQCFTEFQRLHLIYKDKRFEQSLAASLFKNYRKWTIECLPFEDKLIADAHSTGIVDYVALSTAMRTFRRKSDFLRVRHLEQFGIDHRDENPVAKTTQDCMKLQLLNWIYGKDSSCLVPLHFAAEPKDTAGAVPNTSHDVGGTDDNQGLFLPLTKGKPLHPFECRLAITRHHLEDHMEPVQLDMEKTRPIDIRATAIFEPSCCTVRENFLPALPEKYTPASQAFNRMCDHLKDMDKGHTLDKAVFQDSEGLSTLRSMIMLFGNVLSSDTRTGEDS
ncbi:KRR1 small subunit processome component [Perkinsela sp. CCAP 1560/4]|nr:KRR1 small subunit processome component [Perkinsela sp. CCAP 1560/4]|eukprot:KNH06678.1 KRR1 small subunit processome component [Perkinsela sp. CCAP 1560/4]